MSLFEGGELSRGRNSLQGPSHELAVTGKRACRKTDMSEDLVALIFWLGLMYDPLQKYEEEEVWGSETQFLT